MKGNRLKTLGFALLGGLALLFAGCGQQGGTQPGDGRVETVGIDLGQPGPGGVFQGVINIRVSVNEGARVRTIALEVDGQEVNRVDVQGLRAQSLQPQAITYTIPLDTAALGADGQPRFRNGTRTLTVKVTDAQGNTKSASTQAVFRNQDYVRGLVVSQTDNPRAPVTAGGIKWYGNGDVKVSVDIVNYSGATYTLSGTGFPFTLNATGGQGGALAGYQLRNATSGGFSPLPSASVVSGEVAIQLSKSANSSFEGSGKLEIFDTSTNNAVASVSFGLDNKGPSQPTGLEAKRFFEKDFGAVSGNYAPSSLLRGQGATDGGVGGVVYTLRLNATVGTETYTLTLPSNLSGVASKSYSYTLSAADALGNPSTTLSSPSTITVDERSFSISGLAYTTTYNAGQSLNFTAGTISGSTSGSVTWVLALRDGTNLFPVLSGNSLSALNSAVAAVGVQYALVAVDQAGNFALAPLTINVTQVSSDTQAPSVTVNNLQLNPSASGSATGTAADNVAGSGYLVAYVETGSAGGFTFFRYADQTDFKAYPATFPTFSFTTSSSPYSRSVQAPNFTGTLGIRVLAVDSAWNVASANGTLTVQ